MKDGARPEPVKETRWKGVKKIIPGTKRKERKQAERDETEGVQSVATPDQLPASYSRTKTNDCPESKTKPAEPEEVMASPSSTPGARDLPQPKPINAELETLRKEMHRANERITMLREEKNSALLASQRSADALRSSQTELKAT